MADGMAINSGGSSGSPCCSVSSAGCSAPSGGSREVTGVMAYCSSSIFGPPQLVEATGTMANREISIFS